MDIVEQTIIVDIAQEEIRDILLKAYRKGIAKTISRTDITKSFLCPTCNAERSWKDGSCCSNCGQRLIWRC